MSCTANIALTSGLKYIADSARSESLPTLVTAPRTAEEIASEHNKSRAAARTLRPHSG